MSCYSTDDPKSVSPGYLWKFLLLWVVAGLCMATIDDPPGPYTYDAISGPSLPQMISLCTGHPCDLW